MTLKVDNISVKINQIQLLRDVSFALASGEVVALLGPNGAGKTTLLRAALGFIKLSAGEVTLSGENVSSLSATSRAQRIAYLPQIRPLAWPNQVRDVVALGRYAHGARLGRLGKIDANFVDGAIKACDISHLLERNMDSLSGGEIARVHCARAFAANASFIIADEPVASLDPRHQHRIMKLMRNYVHAEAAENINTIPRSVLVVLHDINLAAQYADRLIWMKDGEIVSTGTPDETLTQNRLREIYGVDASISKNRVHIIGYI